jgi:hypothetical protein
VNDLATSPAEPSYPALAGVARHARLLKLLAGWALVAAGAFLLAMPWNLKLGPEDTEWTYGGLTGIALAGLGFSLIVAGLRPRSLQRLRAYRREFGSIGLVAGMGIAITYAIVNRDLAGIGVMGLIVLLTVLMATNLMSGEDVITADEVRTAVTVAIVSVFLALLAFGQDDTLAEGSILAETFEHFWTILLTVVGFYFTTTAAEGVVKTLKGNAAAAKAKPAPEGPAA